MRLWVVGMMGTGKTTVGRLVAGRVGAQFFDTDELVEQAANATIAEIWDRLGEPGFRAMEAEAILEVSTIPNAVIASGGGAVVHAGNRSVMKSSGLVVWLRAPTQVALDRMPMTVERPLLAGGGVQVLDRIWEERRGLYEEVADHALDTEGYSPEEVAESTVGLWNR
ncbi:MAG: shikimate kinase [Acidimicrobiia bacterium]|nr:shikimate kinase [Acidimicrobiia bacterium]